MRRARRLARVRVLRRTGARRTCLCRRHDPRRRRAGNRVRRIAQALQRAPDRRADGADRHLQHAHPRRAGAPDRPRTASPGLSSAMPDTPLLVIEDDPFLRVLQVVLDPDTPAERYAAFADFFAHDANFDDYCAQVRARVPGLFPALVQLVDTQEELRGALAVARGVAVEALAIGREELASAPNLKFVQKYGLGLGGIDTAACAERGVAVLNIRRRANIACAEHALALMLMQARKLDRMVGLVTAAKLDAAGYPYKPFDRRHTPYSNWG